MIIINKIFYNKHFDGCIWSCEWGRLTWLVKTVPQRLVGDVSFVFIWNERVVLSRYGQYVIESHMQFNIMIFSHLLTYNISQYFPQLLFSCELFANDVVTFSAIWKYFKLKIAASFPIRQSWPFQPTINGIRRKHIQNENDLLKARNIR